MGCLLGFGVESDRIGEVPFLAIGCGEIRIQIKVVWIELKCPLTFTDCLIDSIVGKIGGGGNVAGNGRDRIQFLSFQNKLKPFLWLTSEKRK